MRSTGLLVTLFVAVGCASSGHTVPDTETVRIGGVGGGALRTRGGDGAKTSAVNAPLAKVWSVLPQVYDSLGIALTDVDAAQHMLGNTGMKAYKQLGKVPLSTYIDCGNTQAFPSADTYQLQLAVRTTADAAGDKTTVATSVEAVGRPLAFAGEYVRCSSKGTLEARIASMASAMLSGK